ncbi:hypothetical protein E3P99_03724 [Wallemia hederae]|uniref:Telomere length regulation protein conserved domain-containing protein n=1 Tax=Wallemia hederae TaxID=1540922 RepID=A0A4T0FE17_9BASI|nr:hypothetical protein E3P99_03724 [Wallemia hederae]
MTDHLSNYKAELRKGLSDKVYVDRLQHLLPSLLDELRNDRELRQLLISSAEARLKDTAQQISKQLSSDAPQQHISCAVALLQLLVAHLNLYKGATDEEAVDTFLRLPTRIANVREGEALSRIHIPPSLEPDNFIAKYTRDYLSAVTAAPQKCSSYPLERLQLLGCVRYSDRFHSFWSVALNYSSKHPKCCDRLREMLLDLTPSQLTTYFEEFLNAVKDSSRNVAETAQLLTDTFGLLQESNVDTISSALCSGNRVLADEKIMRALALWISRSTHSYTVFRSILNLWSNTAFIKKAPITQLTLYSTILLLLLQKDSVKERIPSNLMHDSSVTNAIPTYLSLSSPLGKLLGMLVAQHLANYDGVDRLVFGEDAFTGSGLGRREIQGVMELLNRSKADDGSIPDPIIEQPPEPSTSGLADGRADDDSDSDSDDSIQGYAIDVDQLQTNKPDSDDEEAANDPTILSKSKVGRPVYIAELNDLLRYDGKEGNEAAVMQEVGLTWAAALINDKREQRELLENSNNLAFTLLTMQDQFALKGFEELRSEALRVLVVSSPQRAGLCLTQHLFSTSLSLRQRLTVLQALGLGVRELSTGVSTRSVSRPSDTPLTTKKAIPANVANDSEIEQILKELSQASIADARTKAGDALPSVARERKLRVESKRREKPLIVEESSNNADVMHAPTNAVEEYRLADRNARVHGVNFALIASECFVMPLINELWRALNQQVSVKLDKELLAPLLRTLALMLWSARNAPEFLHVLAPEALEVAPALPAYVLPDSVAVALAVTSLADDLDGGRVLAEGGKLPLLRRWSENAYQALESTPDSRNCAALLVKVQEIWDRHSTLVMATTLSVGI